MQGRVNSALVGNTQNEVWVPPWLEDETLYSLCGRFHRIAGQRLASSTCMQLFGHPRAGMSHDLPGAIAALTSRTGGRLGTARQVVLERTVLGYYLRFRPESDQENAISQLLHNGPAGMKARLGWLATRMGAAHPLCACDQCVQEETYHHHIPTWHLVHQLPGVWVCPAHGVPLWAARAKIHGVQRFQWLLPDEIQVRDRQCARTTAWPVESGRAAAFIANASDWLVRQDFQSAVDLDRIRAALQRQLIARGLAAPSGRMRLQSIEIEYTYFLNRFRPFPEATALCLSGEAASTSLRRTVFGSSRPMHPLRYVVAAAWLFETWQDFVHAYQSDPSIQPGLPPTTEDTDDPTNRNVAKEELVRLVQIDGLSVRAASRRVGISVQTGLVWASAAGVAIQHRPKQIMPTDRQRITSALEAGRSKQAIATRFGVSIVSITRILLSTPGLSEARAETLTQRRLVRARRHLESVIRSQTASTVISLRRNASADTTWLYRHDRDWLMKAFDGLRPNTRARLPRSRVDWSERDAGFAKAIQKIRSDAEASMLMVTHPSRSKLIHAVPGLITKIKHLDRMPLTQAALDGTDREPAGVRDGIRRAQLSRP